MFKGFHRQMKNIVISKQNMYNAMSFKYKLYNNVKGHNHSPPEYQNIKGKKKNDKLQYYLGQIKCFYACVLSLAKADIEH